MLLQTINPETCNLVLLPFCLMKIHGVPVYFKLGVIKDIKKNVKKFILLCQISIANCGYGVSVNVKAARAGAELYVLLCPDFHCSAHSVDGCWK